MADPNEESAPRQRTPLGMFALDVIVGLPFGAWTLMLGLPYLGLHISFWSAVKAHLFLGASLSAMRLCVRTERDQDEAIARSRARRAMRKEARRG